MKLKNLISVLTATALAFSAVEMLCSSKIFAEEINPENYSYEITPLLEPFNEYFFVKTDNPDPTSFRFVDRSTIYNTDSSSESLIAGYDSRTGKTLKYADVVYENAETGRVNGGYILKSGVTDGGEIVLQKKEPSKEYHGYFDWIDTNVKVTLPKLIDDVDYLINTYATKDNFFDNMDAVQSGFSSICFYSGSYIRGQVVKTGKNWTVSRAGHIDQSFYIYSPYDRKDNKSLFASAIYPYRYDSLGFPSVMATVSKRLDSSSSYEWSSSSHYIINVTKDGQTKSYGGEGNGEGQGLSEDKLTRKFTFTSSDEAISLENIAETLKAYEKVEMPDDIPRDGAVTWKDICDNSGNGTWAKIGGGYAYFYKKDNQDYFWDDEWGVGYSLYWGGSLGYASDAWVDGRWVSKYELYYPGEKFENHPTSDIILTDVSVPVKIDYDYNYNYSTGKAEYTNVKVEEGTRTVCYKYDSESKTWKGTYNDSPGYATIADFTSKGLIDGKYLNSVELTLDEVKALNVDRNTNKNPEYGLIYDGSADPGTRGYFKDYIDEEMDDGIYPSKSDPNKDGNIDAKDATMILVNYANFLYNGTASLDARDADANGDGSVDAKDATAILVHYANYLYSQYAE